MHCVLISLIESAYITFAISSNTGTVLLAGTNCGGGGEREREREKGESESERESNIII